MRNLQELVTKAADVEDIGALLALVRMTLIACAEDLRRDISGQKIIRDSFYRSNKALATWESEKAFGISRLFKSDRAEGGTP